jgi:hypothetical protein
VAQRSLRDLGAPALAPCHHLAKQNDPDQHHNLCQQEANYVPIPPQSASRLETECPNLHSNPYAAAPRGSLAKKSPATISNMRRRRGSHSSDRFFAYFGTSGQSAPGKCPLRGSYFSAARFLPSRFSSLRRSERTETLARIVFGALADRALMRCAHREPCLSRIFHFIQKPLKKRHSS